MKLGVLFFCYVRLLYAAVSQCGDSWQLMVVLATYRTFSPNLIFLRPSAVKLQARMWQTQYSRMTSGQTIVGPANQSLLVGNISSKLDVVWHSSFISYDAFPACAVMMTLTVYNKNSCHVKYFTTTASVFPAVFHVNLD